MDVLTSDSDMASHVVADVPHGGLRFREFVAMVAAMMAMNALAIDTMLPALPQIGGSLGIGDENMRQWIITAYLLGFGGANILYGPLSDRFGRRPILIGGMASYVIFSIGTALAPSFAVLLLFRVLQGFAVAATRVVTVSVVRDCYGGRQMARVMSLAMMVFMIVPVLAPSIGQLAMLFVPWRGLFAGLGAYGILVLIWATLRLPETLHPEYRRPIDIPTLIGGVRRMFSEREAVGYMLVQAVLTGALFGFINSVQQVFADVFHAPKAMPLAFAVIASMMAVASLLNSRIVERLGTRRVSHSALLGFTSIEIAHLAIAASGHETIMSFAVCQAAAMFCFGLTMGNFGAMAMEPLADVAGIAASIQGFVTTIGGALLGFWIGQHFDGTTVPLTAGFAAAGLCALAIVLVTERGRLFRPHIGS